MEREERKAWIRLLTVLVVVGLVRLGWAARAGEDVRVGELRDPGAALDTVTALKSEADRRASPLGPGERLDPNTASEVDLDRLPGVGPSTAAAIVAGRAGGAYRSVEDLQRVRGIGQATAAKMAPHLALPDRARGTVAGGTAGRVASRADGTTGRATGPPTSTAPIDLNRATAGELTGLPGIGPALAARIVELRERRGRFRRIEELLEVRGIGPATLDRIRERGTIR